MKEITMATNFEPHECVIFVQSTKIGTHENKAIHSIHNPRKLIASYSKQHVVLFIDISQVKLSSSVFLKDYVKRYLIQITVITVQIQGSKLTLANSQSAS